MQEKKNSQLVLFVCMLILLVGMWVNSFIWPPKKPAPPDEAEKDKVVEVKPKEKPKEVKGDKNPPKVPAQPVKKTPRQFVRLGGDDDFNLAVLLDSQGGGVLKIVMNKFDQADPQGRPVWEDASHKTHKKLEFLMEEMNKDNPSNLLFHFDPKNPADPRPLDTLGAVNWEIVEPAQVNPEEVYPRVVFQAEVGGVRITKAFSLEKDSYHIGLEVKLERLADGKSTKPLPFRYQLTSGHGLRMEGDWYTTTFRNAIMCRLDAKGVPWREFQDLRYINIRDGGDKLDSDSNEEKFLSYAGVALQYFASVLAVDNDQDDRKFLESARPTLERTTVKGHLTGSGIGEFTLTDNDKKKRTFTLSNDHLEAKEQLEHFAHGAEFGVVYFTDALDNDVALEIKPGEETNPLFQNDLVVRVNTKEVMLKLGEPVVHKYLLYNGPVKVRLLAHLEGDREVPDELVDLYLNKLHLNTLTDYHFQGQGFPAWFGEHISSSIGLTTLLISTTNMMHWILTTLHRVIPVYGICIILLTIIVRGCMFPVSRKMALTSMRMQQLAPEIKKLQEKHKDDKQALTQGTMELYRKHKVNPLGSCWMIFLQTPIFLGLYYALQESIHFRLAPFLWMENLAAPDMLIHWGEKIPFLTRPQDYGGFLYLGPYFNILPVLAVTLMIFQQKMTMPPPTDENAAMQQKIMKYMMIFMGLMFFKVASGLCLYFIASSLWGFAERKLLPKKKKDEEVGAENQEKLGLLQKALSRFDGEKNQANGGGPTAVKETGNGSPSSPSNIPSPSQVRRNKRKALKNKMERGRDDDGLFSNSPVPNGSDNQDQDTGFFGTLKTRWRNTRRRVKTWWAEILDQARKK